MRMEILCVQAQEGARDVWLPVEGDLAHFTKFVPCSKKLKQSKHKVGSITILDESKIFIGAKISWTHPSELHYLTMHCFLFERFGDGKVDVRR